MSVFSQFLSRTIQSPAIFFPVSGSYVIPFTGLYRISGIGAGGSGAVAYNTSNVVAANGGGGGGFAEREMWLLAGDVVVFTIGAGGAAVFRSAAANTHGNAGGITTITCAARGLSLSMTGGGAGLFRTTAATLWGGGLGGVGSGGDINFSGGNGGDLRNSTLCAKATGGGAAGSPYGNGGNGGNANGTVFDRMASGGGGVGENNGGYANVSNQVSGGGGVGGNAPASLNIATNPGGISPFGVQTTMLTIALQEMNLGFLSLFDPLRALHGAGGSGIRATLGHDPIILGGPGAGSGAVWSGHTPLVNNKLLVHPPLGGTGGAVKYDNSTNQIFAGDAGFGGGGGAAISASSGVTSGAGGPGLGIIERIG